MWTRKDIMDLRLKLGMSDFQFAKELDVSMATVRSWELGVTILPFYEAKLDSLKSQASSYLADKARLADMLERRALDKQKSEYITELLPDGKGSVSVKR
jgi:transcriptional regulator with XRE-family HTH domain